MTARHKRGGKPRNRLNERHGKLKVIAPDGAGGWIALCDCGRLRRFSRKYMLKAGACGHCAPVYSSKTTPYNTIMTERDEFAQRLAFAIPNDDLCGTLVEARAREETPGPAHPAPANQVRQAPKTLGLSPADHARAESNRVSFK